ncbi:PREDICTED: probable serine hydrolase [Bactrocera latifrons]|uniref:Putative serine hydrolase n=1 Tax=Bactrocera latifrons TaxID=174628 RepID=A0A0K8VS44_BACLA|nr:PREDICTED: probable serine hydrolase [Bactrocera latifrons]
MTEPAPREYEDIRIPVPWGHLAGRWYGDRNIRPILALHGWLDNMGTWNRLLPLLPRHVGILCIELTGHGYSSQLPKGLPYHTIDYVNLIVRIMKEYKWQKVSLLTHSLSSLVSFIYTSLYPGTVDMLIAIDLIIPVYYTPDLEIKALRMNAERLLVEVERAEKLAMHEPPAYTFEELKQVLYEGSKGSVELENCEHLLTRNIQKSTKYPDKYYFARDARLKYYIRFISCPQLHLEMAKRIKNVPYLLIKGSLSDMIKEDSDVIINVLRRNNPHFEYYEIEGTHHVHLNNPEACAAVINPFINAHRPAMPKTWCVDDAEETPMKSSKSVSKKRKRAEGRLRCFRSKL